MTGEFIELPLPEMAYPVSKVINKYLMSLASEETYIDFVAVSN